MKKNNLKLLAVGFCLAGTLGLGSAHAESPEAAAISELPGLDCGAIQQAAAQVTAAFTQLGMADPGAMVVALAVSTTKNLPLNGVLSCLSS